MKEKHKFLKFFMHLLSQSSMRPADRYQFYWFPWPRELNDSVFALMQKQNFRYNQNILEISQFLPGIFNKINKFELFCESCETQQ